MTVTPIAIVGSEEKYLEGYPIAQVKAIIQKILMEERQNNG